MKYTTKQNGAELTVLLEGELLAKDPQSFRKLLDTSLNPGIVKCIFDLSKIDFIDSGGLGMLLLTQETLKAKNRTLIIRHPQKTVKQILQLAQFDQILTIEF